MSALSALNPKAEMIRSAAAFNVNLSAALGLQAVLKTNLGPRGTLKMLVGGAGQIKITKDGSMLLKEMQIQHPTAIMIARTATAQDDICGDGTTSTVIFIGELLKQCARYIQEGVHPRVLSDGLEKAKAHALKFIEEYKTAKPDLHEDRDMLLAIARSSVGTKLIPELADHMAKIVTDAVLCIHKPGQQLDLHMVERMKMVHKRATDTRLVPGIVLDHGSRHPDMPKRLENCYIVTLNVSLEYEKSEHTASFVYSNAQERERLVASERKFVDEKVMKLIELKRALCTPENGKTFVVINQKGIDPLSLDLLAKDGIIGIRRAKRRNMERITLACGGVPCNSVDDIEEEHLGWADLVYEEVLGDDKYTFVEGVKNPLSATILVKGPDAHTIAQLMDAVRDGTRAVANAIEDEAVVAGAGAFELACARSVREFKSTISGKAKLVVEAFAEAMLVIPKTLCENSGFDVMDTIIALQEEMESAGADAKVGLDCLTGEPMLPAQEGVWDIARVKMQSIQLSTVIASQLLLVDELMRAGRGRTKG